jgi:CheY-like chemotaxis protein
VDSSPSVSPYLRFQGPNSGRKTNLKRNKASRSRASEECASLPVLVIEDDPALRERVCTTLESHGYPVVGQNSEIGTMRDFSSWRVTGVVVGTQQLNGVHPDAFHEWLSQQRRVSLTEPFSPKRFLSTIRKSIGRPPNSERILVVDDEEPIREIMAVILAFSGYRCRGVAGGHQALKLLDSGERFDLVTTDLMNAPMDGITFLEQIKCKYPDIPVLMITAVHDISVALASIRNGAYDYVLKPFEREQLIFAIRRALESCSLKKENRALRAKIARLERGSA